MPGHCVVYCLFPVFFYCSFFARRWEKALAISQQSSYIGWVGKITCSRARDAQRKARLEAMEAELACESKDAANVHDSLAHTYAALTGLLQPAVPADAHTAITAASVDCSVLHAVRVADLA